MAPPPTQPARPRVFLDLALNGSPAGRLIIELAADAAPRTAENFRALCTGEAGTSASGVRLWYKGCAFHRCVSDFMLQGGDFTAGNGTGGESIYGVTFPDEAFTLKHTGPGVLSMANAGRDTNGSQFFLTTVAAPWLDGKHVVFGRVVSGLGVLRKVDAAASSSSGAPRAKLVIADCGELATAATAARDAAVAEEVDADAASRARLARLQGGGGGAETAAPVPRPKLPVRTAQDDLEEAEAAERAKAAAEAPAVAAAEPAAGGEEAGAAATAAATGARPSPPAEPQQPTSAREAKLAGLRARLAAARKANAGAAIAEKKREAAARGGAGGDGGGGAGPRPAGGGSWKAWEAEQAAAKAAALAKAGLGPDKGYLLARPAVEPRDDDGMGGRRKKKARAGGEKEPRWGGEALAAAYERRVALTVDPAAAGTSTGGGPPSEEALDRLVAGLNAAAAGRTDSSIRRGRGPGTTGAAGGISAPNAAFNDKLQRAYGKVAAEIRANLERGTALPE